MEAENETLYEGIFRVRSAQAVVIDASGLRKLTYWRPDPANKTRYPSHEEYAEHFGALFREAVRCRMRTTGDVGVLLSGGLDSTSIACMAQKLHNEGASEPSIRTFSTTYDTLPCNEREYVQFAVDKWELKATLNVYERHPEWLDFGLMSRFPDTLYSPTDHIQEFSQMRDGGIRVYFDGIGGDELLAPDLACITDDVRKFRLARAYKQLRVASTVYGSSMARFGLMYCVAPFVPKPMKRLTTPLVRRANGAIGSVLCESYERDVCDTDSVGTPEFAEARCRYTYESFYTGSSPMAVDLQELLACRFPLECRRPFADKRLLEFTLSIPAEEVWRTGEPIKTILRDAMKNVLPEKVRRRTTEAEFSPLINRELRVRQRDEADRLIRDSYLVKLGIVERDRLRDAWKRYYEQSNVSAASVVMYALGWELWYRSSILNLTDRSRVDETTYRRGQA
jgi:asparagine synthase (glutamine-hydrolysing)